MVFLLGEEDLVGIGVLDIRVDLVQITLIASVFSLMRARVICPNLPLNRVVGKEVINLAMDRSSSQTEFTFGCSNKWTMFAATNFSCTKSVMTRMSVAPSRLVVAVILVFLVLGYPTKIVTHCHTHGRNY